MRRGRGLKPFFLASKATGDGPEPITGSLWTPFSGRRELQHRGEICHQSLELANDPFAVPIVDDSWHLGKPFQGFECGTGF